MAIVKDDPTYSELMDIIETVNQSSPFVIICESEKEWSTRIIEIDVVKEEDAYAWIRYSFETKVSKRVMNFKELVQCIRAMVMITPQKYTNI